MCDLLTIYKFSYFFFPDKRFGPFLWLFGCNIRFFGPDGAPFRPALSSKAKGGLRAARAVQAACIVTTNGLYCYNKRLVVVVQAACSETIVCHLLSGIVF